MIEYQSGFGNHFSSEARVGALPFNQNSPQTAPLGLYAEQLSGSAFTAPRSKNLSSWLYRIHPSVTGKAFVPVKGSESFGQARHLNPNPFRWNPLPDPAGDQDFLSLRTICSSSSPFEQKGVSVHLYAFNQGMANRYLMNADGEFLILPQQGRIEVRTEMGILFVEPKELVVIPRAVKFQINPLDQTLCKGYVAENFGQPLRLPELGVIGASGLAHPRHFVAPTAAFEDRAGEFEIVGRFGGELWVSSVSHCPLDVVAWHGNYTPYKYDLRNFNTINTVSFDHPDPSIFTVLTSPSEVEGVANMDFVIFPPRWMVAEHTFRPPYFHRNCMSEYMGLIEGVYDAKSTGFVPGGGSLHNLYTPHGPDVATYKKASQATLKPEKIENTLAFMFESRLPYRLTDFALNSDLVQKDYTQCWQGFEKNFS